MTAVLAVIADETKVLVSSILTAAAAAEKPKVRRAPTEAMVAAARAKMKRDGVKRSPRGVMDDFEACRAFLGPLEVTADRQAGASDKQLALIKRLIDKGHSAPNGFAAGLTMAAASHWIDSVFPKKAVVK